MKSDGFTALIVETSLLSPFAITYLIYHEAQHGGSWGNGSDHDILFIILTGLATISPLLFFTSAAKRIPFTTQVISFSLIWLAVIVYSRSKRSKKIEVRLEV